MMNTPTVDMQIRLIDPNAKIPFRKRSTDAGFDLFAIEPKVITPQQFVTIRTGLQLSCPPGYFYTIEGRSSLLIKGIIPNRAIIDSTYTGELTVTLCNHSRFVFEVEIGDRIAQVILSKQYDMRFEEVAEFSSYYSQRGTDGFGSSGR
jgi:dUTP pyrophosphatase